MKDTIKMVVSHFFIITVSIFVCTALSNSLNDNHDFSSDYPWSVIITGAITALPSFLFYFKNGEPTKKQYTLRIIIHFCIIESIVLILGAFYGWYSDLLNAIVIFAMVLLIYLFVCLCTYFSNKSTANNINSALEKLNADEEN